MDLFALFKQAEIPRELMNGIILLCFILSWVVSPIVAQTEKSGELTNLLERDSILRASGDITERAEVCEKIAIFYFQYEPEKSIPYFGEASRLFDKLGNYKKSGFCLQNSSFIYDEKLGDFPKAIEYAQQALFIWTEHKDSLQIANMVKYIGLLNGKTGEFVIAKDYLQRAIGLYKTLKFDMGLAVSYHDLAIVNEEAGLLDSSIYYLNLAKDIWKSLDNPDVLRIFILNNALFRVYLRQNDLDAAYLAYLENEPWVERIHWQHVLEFYKLARTFFEKRRDPELVAKYDDKLNALEKQLKEQGIKF